MKKTKKAVVSAGDSTEVESEANDEANEGGFNADEEGFHADEEEGFYADEEEGSNADDEEGSNADDEEFHPDQKASDDDDGVESEDGAYVTPKALKKYRMIPSESDLSDVSSAEAGGGGKAEKTHIEWDLQAPKRIDLKAQRDYTRVKEKRTFREEVEEQRVVVARETANKVQLIVH